MTPDQDNRCTFTFRDGRRCRMPGSRNDPSFCVPHYRQLLKEHGLAATVQPALVVPGKLDTRRAIRRTLKRVIQAVTDGRLTAEQGRALAEMGRLLMVFTRRKRKPRRARQIPDKSGRVLVS